MAEVAFLLSRGPNSLKKTFVENFMTNIYKKITNTTMVVFFLLFLLKTVTMNFTDLDKEISQEFGITKTEARKILCFIQNKLREKIVYGLEISFRGLGVFLLRVRQPKKYLNLQTNKMSISNKSYFLDFKVSRKLKERLKKKPVY